MNCSETIYVKWVFKKAIAEGLFNVIIEKGGKMNKSYDKAIATQTFISSSERNIIDT